MSPKHWISCGAFLAALAVAAGAFGSHGLKDKLTTEQLDTFEVAARYQMYHALALILVGVIGRVCQPRRCLQLAGWAFLLGMMGFSGGLYAWLFTHQKWLMMVVPLGGSTFIVGWIALAISALRQPRSDATPE